MKISTFGRAIVFRVVLAITLAAGMGFLPGGRVQATPSCGTVVTNNSDSAAGSLRWEIACNSSGATITFAPALSGQTITLTSGEISIAKVLTIDGSSLSSPVTISGNNLSRIFNVTNPGDLTLDSLKLINGKAVNGSAVLNNGALHVYNSTLSNNTAASTTLLQQNFDGVTAPTLPTGWTTSSSGAQSNWTTNTAQYYSSPNSAFSPDPSDIGVNELVSPSFTLSSALPLTFQNRYGLENNFDGAVLEISIDGGAFQDIVVAGGSFVSGGYNGTISCAFSNPLAWCSAWTGISGGGGSPIYVTTSVNLPPAAVGHSVQLRWRVGTDSAVGSLGQWIDDVLIGTGPSQGGAISNHGLLEVAASTFTGNTADEGGAIFTDTLSSASVLNSTFSGNIAATHGGGIYNDNMNDSTIDLLQK